MFTLQSRHRLDIRLRHFAYALVAGVWAREPERLSKRLETGWSRAGEGLACRSVRSGFHLLLDSLALPAGTEVLVSAVTHPDMVRILEAHGLVAVPVDLDIATLAPRLDLAERLVTPRTAAMLVAHLFGGRVDMNPLADFAKRHRLLLWEDCAQAFTGPRDAREARVGPSDARDARAEVSMYSFGALKTCTALGGALLKVKDPHLLARMRASRTAGGRRRAEPTREASSNSWSSPWSRARFRTAFWLASATCLDATSTVWSTARSGPSTPAPCSHSSRCGPARRCWPRSNTGCAPLTGSGCGGAPPQASGWAPTFPSTSSPWVGGWSGARTGCFRSSRAIPSG
jgi:hypothetical protein